jgi:hypothetical protein
MSTPMSHQRPAQPSPRHLTWFLVAGLAVAGVTFALVLTLSGSKSPYPVHAVAAPAVASPAPGALPRAAQFEHGMPSLNPQALRTMRRNSGATAAASKAQRYAPNAVLRKEGLIRRAGR